MLLHNVEKFNFFPEQDMLIPGFEAADALMWKWFFFFFGGKAYAIFSMLFGFSFWIQLSRAEAEGRDISWRFVRRMGILFVFGLVHSLYYSGDLLIFYSTFGLGLVCIRRVRDGVAFALALLLLALPLDLYQLVRMLADPAYLPPPDISWGYWSRLTPVQTSGSFFELVRAYITDGLAANVTWTWEAGRMFHIPGLFLVGMLAARRKVFTEGSSRAWLFAFVGSIAVFAPLHYVGEAVPTLIPEGALRYQVASLVNSYGDLAFTLTLVSAFILLWRLRFVEPFLRVLIPYGRMSLTNYTTQAATGLILYTGCGFGLYHYLGATLSVLTGLCVLVVQIIFSRWCLKRWGQGPLEKLWRRWTNYERAGRVA